MRSGRTSASTLCICGHPRAAHQHFRQGSDCGACGSAVCPRFRSSRGRLFHPIAVVLAARQAPVTSGQARGTRRRSSG